MWKAINEKKIIITGKRDIIPEKFKTFYLDINATNILEENKTMINVYDILGNIVRTENIKLTENYTKVFDFSSLANGSYIVEVTDGKQKSVARLIKL